MGKDGLGEYSSRGYLNAEGGGESVSRTLDFGFADYSTAQAFKVLLEKAGDKFKDQEQEIRGKVTSSNSRYFHDVLTMMTCRDFFRSRN